MTAVNETTGVAYRGKNVVQDALPGFEAPVRTERCPSCDGPLERGQCRPCRELGVSAGSLFDRAVLAAAEGIAACREALER